MSENLMVVSLPLALTFLVSKGKDAEGKEITETITIPEGSKMLADASSNFAVYAGFLPESPRVYETEDKNSKLVSIRLANKREIKTALGEPKIFDSSRYVKFRGQLTSEVEGLNPGSRIVVAGFMNSDRVPAKINGEKDKFLDNIMARSVTVLSKANPRPQSAEGDTESKDKGRSKRRQAGKKLDTKSIAADLKA